MVPPPGLKEVLNDNFSFDRGHPLPLGATLIRNGINFALFSRHATSVKLVLFLPGKEQEIASFELDSKRNRTGDVWHTFIGGLDSGIEYAYRLSGPENMRHQYDPDTLVHDPYAIALYSRAYWGDNSRKSKKTFRCSLLKTSDYDWENDQPINRPMSDSIIYELHVRGFTHHGSSGVTSPGTFQGIIDKIPYLKDLGVTAVELLPVTEFDELDNERINPIDNSPLHNFWGYNPLSFFAPKSAYAENKTPGGEIDEFRDMVKALHAAGIEVILDVVFNHSGEGDHRGPKFSFKGIDNKVYYMLAHDDSYMNFSGCGNTINCNHPYVRHFILDSLRYWVTEMHVDGFRFDLASVLGRDQDGSVLANPPLLEQIAGDPVLADTKLIAEAWDAAGLYQVGSFPNWGRWAEWNGRFRDDIRNFVRGEPGMVRHLATRLAGSADLYQSNREPGHGINFITSHDGFTLWDLVSYNWKHNLANGEESRDGDNHNQSWNCGVEGKTDNPDVLALRNKQVRNFAVLLLFSRGVPMILAGDEFGRSQQGNNNAYCQDNEISWLNWELKQHNHDLYRFFKLLIAFRKSNALLRYDSFINHDGQGPHLNWHGSEIDQPDWSNQSHCLAMQLTGKNQDGSRADVYLIANAYWEPLQFHIPPPPVGHWQRFIDTNIPGDGAITELDQQLFLPDLQYYQVAPRSVVVLTIKV